MELILILVLNAIVAFAAIGFSIGVIDDWVNSLRTKEPMENSNQKLMLVTITWVLLIVLQWI